MEQITKDLQSFLVQMHYEPDSISHQMEHYIEHLFHLLSVDDERLLCQYFGLFGQEQKALSQLARDHEQSQEDCMAHIDQLLRRLSITPEWQLLREVNKTNKD